MSLIKIMGGCLSLLLATGLSTVAWATHDDIHVKVQDTVQNCPGGAGACKTEFILSNSSCQPTSSDACPKTYTVGSNSIVIKAKDYTYGHAKVKASDSTNDTLQLVNAIIVPQNNVFGYHLEFWRSFHAPPSPTAGTPKKYKMTANGTLTRPGNTCSATTQSANGDSATFSTYLNGDHVGTQQSHVGTDCVSINLSETTEESYASLPDPRDMKADLWFTMQANDELMFTATAGYKIFSTSLGGDEEPPCNAECMGLLDDLSPGFDLERIPTHLKSRLPEDVLRILKEGKSKIQPKGQ